MICTSGQASPARVSLSHLSGGNRYGLRLQSVSGTNAGITFSPFINSSYQDFMRITYDTTTNDGKLGINNLTPSYALDVEHSGNNAANAAVSRFGVAAIKTDGTYWNWGNNVYGSLGQGQGGSSPFSAFSMAPSTLLA